jgi:hypothetical protein
MAITWTTSIVLAFVGAAVGAMAILGLIGVLVNRFRNKRRREIALKMQAKRNKSGSPKRKSSNQETGRKLYTINDDTYSMGTFDDALRTFRSEPFPNMSDSLPPSDSRSMGGGPYTPTALDHSLIQSDFDDVWSFIAVGTSRAHLVNSPPA